MIRVLLAHQSPAFDDLLSDLIKRVPDIKVVGEAANPLDLLAGVKHMQADIVIQAWPESGKMPGICSHLLAEYPDVLLVGVPENRNHVIACRQTIAKRRLRKGELRELLSALR